MARTYRKGDYLAIDDISGQTHYASEMRMTWDGKFVHKKNWDARHPQDFVRGRSDDQTVPIARPRPEDHFIEVDYFTGYLMQQNGYPILQENGKEIIW